MAGEIKVYDVGGKEIDGRIMPTGTALRLYDEEAERLGLKKPSRRKETEDQAEDDSALLTSKKAATRSSKRAAPRSARRPRS